MNFTKKITVAAGFLASIFIYSSLSAATVDFAGNSAWGGAPSRTIGNVTVTTNGPDIFWENDGLGVNGGTENDEVDNAESLTVSFGSPVIITSIWLDDFWTSTSAGTAEQAYVTFNGTSPFTLTASKPFNSNIDPTSFDITSLFTAPVTSILFQAIDPSSTGSSNGDDYALARVDYTAAPVPVPAAFWLLGSAMVFLFRKRQTS